MPGKSDSYTISGRMVFSHSDSPAAGYRVRAYDVDHFTEKDCLGEAVTDKKGHFKIKYNKSAFVKNILEAFLEGGPDIVLQVLSSKGDILQTTSPRTGASRFESFLIEVEPPLPKPLSLSELGKVVSLPKTLQAEIKKRGLTQPQDFLSIKGLRAIRNSGLKSGKQSEILSSVKFAAAGAGPGLIKLLRSSGVTSFSQLAGMPQSQTTALVKKLEKEEQRGFFQLKNKAHAVTHALTQAVADLGRAHGGDSEWLQHSITSNVTTDSASFIDIGTIIDDFGIKLPYPGKGENCRQCEDCQQVFSPFAYVLDLLDFIQDMWEIGIDTLESVLYQEIKNLDCQNGLESVPQIQLAIEVLEKYGQSEGAGNANWLNDYQIMADRVLQQLDLDRSDNSWRATHAGLAAAVDSNQPDGQTVQKLISEARTIYVDFIETRYAPLPAPPNNADPEELENHEREQSALRAERETMIEEFNQRIDQITAAALPVYRDQLINTIGEAVSVLERRLFIDLRSAPCHRNSPIVQLIQSLQSFILSAQTGDIEQIKKTGHLQALIGDVEFEALDEARWDWLQSYSTWASAMYVLIYPENLLMPPMLRTDRTPSFQKAMERMMQQANAENADLALSEYEDELKELSSHEFRIRECFLDNQRLVVFGTTGTNLFLNVMKRPSNRWVGWRRVSDWDSGRVPYAIKYVDPGDHSGSKYAGDFIVRVLSPGQFGWTDESIARHYVLVNLQGKNKETFSTTPVTTHSTGNDSQNGGEETETLASVFDSIPDSTSSVRPAGSVAGFFSKINIKFHNTFLRVDIDFHGAGEEPSSQAPEMFQLISFKTVSIGNSSSYYLIAFGKDRSVTFGSHVIIIARFSGSNRTEDWKVISGSLRKSSTPTGGHFTGPSTPQPVTLHNRSRHIYFLERYLHLPMMMGWMLSQAGDHASAHDWYRKIYDPFLPAAARARFPFSQFFEQALDRPENWLDHARDPHGLASKRRGVYLKATVLLMVRNLLDWADHEFALFNAESLNRARKLYLMADRILQAPALDNPCNALQQALEFEIFARFGEAAETVMEEVRRIEEVPDLPRVKRIIGTLRKELNTHSSSTRFLNKAKQHLDRALANQGDTQGNSLGQIQENHSAVALELEDILSVTNLGRNLLDRGFSNNEEEEEKPLPPPTPKSLWFCIPPNPLLAAFAFRAAMGLEKLRSCRNVSGEKTVLPGLPGETIGTSAITDIGQLVSPEDIVITTPPRFRFSYLLQLARQQAQLAQQLGSSLLTTIEKRDSARLELLTAEHNAGIARATVQLKNLGIEASRQALQVAHIQKRRAKSRHSFWQDRVYRSGDPFGLGLSNLEMAALLATGAMAAVQNIELGIRLGAMVGGSIGAVLGGSATAVPGAIASGGVGGVMGLPGGGAGGVIGGAAGVAMVPALAAAAATLPTIASYERRAEDWMHELSLSEYDMEISDAQIRLSADQLNISKQDKTIADLQDQHAGAVLEFLRNEKVANEALYDVMVDILLDNYRTVMQIATSTAHLAQNALEFESQQKLHLIQGNYWTINRDELTPEQKDLGLLGAERLLTSLVRLENQKLESEKRSLNIKKTISLAALAPTEFVQFKQNGDITFTTAMEWFDRDFPGHYQRLIKNVEVTLVALTPPVDGIHAMLKNHGTSTVEVKREGVFVLERNSRAFAEYIALDSPFNDSGVFQLQPQDHLLRPFEGLGVETSWTLELPKASNRFHFDSIMDVYFTIEYSAFYDEIKKQQVIQRLGNVQSSDVAFSFKANFPDLWYHLFNPGPQQRLEFEMGTHAFPPNLEMDPANLQPLKEITVIFEAGEGNPVTNEILQGFKLKKDGHEIAVDAQLEGSNGMFSTRMLGTAPLPPDLDPTGKWELVVDNAIYDADNNKRKVDRLNNIVIVMTVQGKVVWQ